jgi:hypothetical protein
MRCSCENRELDIDEEMDREISAEKGGVAAY